VRLQTSIDWRTNRPFSLAVETIRTDGHFYLIGECLTWPARSLSCALPLCDDPDLTSSTLPEEYLPTHISLDALCLRYPHQRLPYPLVLKIIQQLVSVVRDGLHSHQVVHRDIKPGSYDAEKPTLPSTVDHLSLYASFQRTSSSTQRLAT